MRTWHKRVIVNTAKAAIPGKQHLRQALRHVVPYKTSRGNDSNLFDSIVQQIELLRNAGVDVRGRRILEIGTGWHPIAAMAFLAAGAASVTLTDIERLLDTRLIRSAIDFVMDRRDVLVDRLGADGFDRLQVPNGSLAEMLSRLGLTYFVPYRTKMSSNGSADIVVSCSVFEHIPAKTVENMLAEFRRILIPGGAMVHFIDYSDHYWMDDKSISRCNFLRYEEWMWRLLSINPQTYHNRLRHSDYAEMLRRHGFRIAFEYCLSREKEQREVAAMRLASRFVGRDIEDLAAVGAHFVAIAP